MPELGAWLNDSTWGSCGQALAPCGAPSLTGPPSLVGGVLPLGRLGGVWPRDVAFLGPDAGLLLGADSGTSRAGLSMTFFTACTKGVSQASDLLVAAWSSCKQPMHYKNPWYFHARSGCGLACHVFHKMRVPPQLGFCDSCPFPESTS